ncbi:helix-turn-helix transcriptional regulator [Terriglobus roseus]|uniref:Transcriptional regulator, AlpA family n=1 Tax=Terriglobus roseus TaxID=392734 RepID=A0A1H4NSE4_9BACT|nr:transcriptional regulator, AlpA family [Terriglobus roseus]
MTTTAPDRLLRLKAVQAIVPLGRSAIYDRIQAQTFPRPVSLGGNAVAWRQSDIDAWVAKLERAKRGA